MFISTQTENVLNQSSTKFHEDIMVTREGPDYINICVLIKNVRIFGMPKKSKRRPWRLFCASLSIGSQQTRKLKATNNQPFLECTEQAQQSRSWKRNEVPCHGKGLISYGSGWVTEIGFSGTYPESPAEKWVFKGSWTILVFLHFYHMQGRRNGFWIG